jgi:hypothetical protein
MGCQAQKGPDMRRALVIAALTLAAAAPASLGLVGNASFGRDVPVRVPASAILVDDHGSEFQPTAVGKVVRSGAPNPVVATSGRLAIAVVPSTGKITDHRVTMRGLTTVRAPTTAGVEPGDDNGGTTTPATPRVEPGDDNGGSTTTGRVEPGDDNGRGRESSSASTGDDGGDGGAGKGAGRG